MGETIKVTSQTKVNMRTGRKQTILNMVSTFISQLLSLGISFFLTPYIVSKLGAAAYGFFGLSNNIIGYTALLTVALNSMSGRFIAVEYHKGEYVEANRYLSSTVLANCCMAIFIVLVLGIITLFLEQILNIPQDIVLDVKFLFTLLFVNSAFGLCTGVFGMPMFIKNRYDISNTMSVCMNIFRVTLIIIAYGFFPAHLWYIGAIGLIVSIVHTAWYYYFYCKMVPEFAIRLSFFQARKVWEMVREGAWNLLSQFSSILNQGLELLLANLFIGAYYMGILSITKSLPFVILGIFAGLGCNFHPECVKYYAEGNMDSLRNLLIKGIRILGALAVIPCAGVFVLGDLFYSLWMPGQNTNLLYGLSVITMAWILTTLPTQTLWYIFTLTKTVKKSSIVLVRYGIAFVVTVIIAMLLIEDDLTKLYFVVSVQSILGIIRFMTFLPSYSSKVLGLPRYTFLKPLVGVIYTCAIVCGIGFLLKYFFIHEYSWFTLVIGALVITLVSLGVSSLTILTKTDRDFILTRILKIKKIRISA